MQLNLLEPIPALHDLLTYTDTQQQNKMHNCLISIHMFLDPFQHQNEFKKSVYFKSTSCMLSEYLIKNEIVFKQSDKT